MKAKPTSSPAVSPAKTSASPAEAPDLPAPVQDCGGNWCEPFAWYDPSSRLWRTWQTSFLDLLSDQAVGWAEYSETWPRAGLMLSGIAYRRQSSAPLTSVTAFGLLPTPIANDAEKRGDFNIDRSKCLPGELRRGPLPMIPTPQARDHFPPHSEEYIAKKKAEGHGMSNLNDFLALNMLPTLMANERDGTSKNYKRGNPNAVGAILNLLPTPKASDADKGGRGDLLTVLRGYESKHAGTLPTLTARDWRSGMASDATHGKNSRPLNETLTKMAGNRSGRMNLRFREWMMGLKTGWMALGPRATATRRSSRKPSRGP